MKSEIFAKALNWAQRKGFSGIRANHEDFDTPASFSKPDADKAIIPDITGELNGGKSYIEIALKGDNEQEIISKWKLFGHLAKRKGGKLYLLASRGHKSFANKIVDDYNLSNAVVVSI